jgi:hypothetical protein
MPALEIIGGLATAPSTTFTAVTNFTGNSNVVRNCDEQNPVKLLSTWADVQGAGNSRIRSPRLHDNVQGIRLVNVVGEPLPQLPLGLTQKLIPQDALTIELTGSATGGDIEQIALLIYYASLPGIEARLIDTAELKNRMVSIMGQENTIATGTAGGWSGEEAINAEFDNFKANTDYALMGFLVSAECLAVRWRGSDTGNLGVGGPGTIDQRDLTARWFCNISDACNLPLIPVFNSANKSSILVDAAQDENGTDVTVTSIFAELSM